MIELCTKRRMITSIVALGVLTVLVLILEEKLTSRHSITQSPTAYPNNNSEGSDRQQITAKSVSKAEPPAVQDASSLKPCWIVEEFSVTGECSPCTPFEISSGTPSACELTGLKEVVKCNISGTQYRSCSSIKSSERARFWVFESLMLLLSVTAYGYFKFRTSQVERLTIKQIERRLASGL